METIAAIATPHGVGGVGIIRISGEDALAIIKAISRKKNGEMIDFLPRYMHYGCIIDGENTIDEALIVYMPNPNSYTGEDVCEIQCHGGSVVVGEILSTVLKAGARLAYNGEFTQRAFINGKLDLSKAEAIADVISAKSSKALSISTKQLQGRFKENIDKICDELLDMVASIEVAIDYPEEEDYAFFAAGQEDILNNINSELIALKQNFQGSKIYRDGIRIAIIGSPNAGKSTLLNTLLDENKAIVTNIAGTTRDVIEGHSGIDGIPVVFVDTAGLRETTDTVEKIGVERSYAELTGADAVFLIIDSQRNTEEIITETSEILLNIDKKKPIFLLLNKADIINTTNVQAKLNDKFNNATTGIFAISAKENTGIIEVKKAVSIAITLGLVAYEDLVGLLNERHGALIEKGLFHIEEAKKSLALEMGLDIAAVDLESARMILGEITGKTANSDVISRVFEKFCLGK